MELSIGNTWAQAVSGSTQPMTGSRSCKVFGVLLTGVSQDAQFAIKSTSAAFKNEPHTAKANCAWFQKTCSLAGHGQSDVTVQSLHREPGRSLPPCTAEISRSADLPDIYDRERLRLMVTMSHGLVHMEKTIVTSDLIGMAVALTHFNYQTPLQKLKLGGGPSNGFTHCERMVAGTVWLKVIQCPSHGLPFGGMKCPGPSRKNGRYGIESDLKYNTMYFSYEVAK